MNHQPTGGREWLSLKFWLGCGASRWKIVRWRGRSINSAASRRDRMLTPLVMVWLMLLQVLRGNTAITHLRQLSGLDFAASSFCEAPAIAPARLAGTGKGDIMFCFDLGGSPWLWGLCLYHVSRQLQHPEMVFVISTFAGARHARQGDLHSSGGLAAGAVIFDGLAQVRGTLQAVWPGTHRPPHRVRGR